MDMDFSKLEGKCLKAELNDERVSMDRVVDYSTGITIARDGMVLEGLALCRDPGRGGAELPGEELMAERALRGWSAWAIGLPRYGMGVEVWSGRERVDRPSLIIRPFISITTEGADWGELVCCECGRALVTLPGDEKFASYVYRSRSKRSTRDGEEGGMRLWEVMVETYMMKKTCETKKSASSGESGGLPTEVSYEEFVREYLLLWGVRWTERDRPKRPVF